MRHPAAAVSGRVELLALSRQEGGALGSDPAGFLAERGLMLREEADTLRQVGAGTEALLAVEIAYFTFPSYEGRGYATAMANLLTVGAGAAPAARTVRAHTLPERNTSVRILEKLGFAHLGQVIDPEDGPVWRWERATGSPPA